MRRTKLAGRLLATALLASACAVSPPPKTTWVPVSETSPAFESAREECARDAVRETETVPGETLASKAAFGIFLKCMREKGWTMSQEVQPAP